MRLPTGQIDSYMNLIHKACGIALMVLAIVFGTKAYLRTFGQGGTSDKIEKTLLHLDESAGATKRLIQEEHDQQMTLYGKLDTAVDNAGTTINTANTTVRKLGSAIDTVSSDFTTTTGAVNGTLGSTQALLGKLTTSAEDLDNALKELPATIKDIDALVKTLNQMGVDIDENLIKDPDIKEALKQVAGLLKELKLTTTDVRLIMDKVSHDYTAPRTKKGWVLAVLRFIIDLGSKGAELKVFLGK